MENEVLDFSYNKPLKKYKSLNISNDMNKKVISLFTFGLFLIIIGAIGTFFEWNQSLIIIGLGLTFESLALIIFAWNRIKK